MGDKGFKHEVFTVLDASDHHNKTSTIVNAFLILLICLNVLAVMLETVESLYKEHEKLFYGFEVFSVTIFTIEYLLRVWAITSEPKYSHPLKGRIKFLFTGGA